MIIVFSALIIILGITYFQNDILAANTKSIPTEEKTSFLVDVSGLYIDGELFTVLSAPEDVEEVLTKYKNHITKPSENNIIHASEFSEEVSIIQVKVNPMEVRERDEVLSRLIQGKANFIEYTVQKDDSVWLIARKNGISIQDVLESSPDLTEHSLPPVGKTLELLKRTPYLNILSQGTRVVQEVIPFEVETTSDPKLRPGSSIIKDIGEDGQTEVTYSYVEKKWGSNQQEKN